MFVTPTVAAALLLTAGTPKAMSRPWYADPWNWGIALAAGALALAIEDGPEGVVRKMVDINKRGSKVTKSTYVSRLGVVTTPAEELRGAASAFLGRPISQNVYAAARMIRSEGVTQGEVRLHVALNDLRTFKYAKNLYELLTYSTDPKRRGLYGAQWSGSVPADGYLKQNARRYSTIGDPYEFDIQLAEKVLAERAAGIDRAFGAVKFIDKSSMGGVQPGTVSFAAKNAEWIAGGYTAFSLPQYGNDLVLYKPTRKA